MFSASYILPSPFSIDSLGGPCPAWKGMPPGQEGEEAGGASGVRVDAPALESGSLELHPVQASMAASVKHRS